MIFFGLVMAFVRVDVPRETLAPKYAPEPSRFVLLEGMQVHFRDEGKGPPLFLIHGTSSSLHTWDGWAARLSSHRRVIRLDLPGYGMTGPAPDADYRAERQARIVGELMDHLKIERADFAGNSMGGRVALTNPQRVRKLVLVDAAGLSGQVPPPIFKVARTRGVGKILTVVSPRWLVKRNVQDVYGDPNRVTEALVDRYYDLTLAAGNRRALVDRLTGPADPDLDARLGEIHAPTLILWGDRDRWIPVAFAARFQTGIRGAKVIQYPDAGHVPMEELPDKTSADADAFLNAP
jgi:pimeloyl-ACP methyl ester carboxylesterase